MITLADNAVTLELPADMAWTDEFTWSPVKQAVTPMVTGSVLIEHSVQQSGRPITLAGGQDRAWVSYGDIVQLKSWADEPGLELTLTIRGVSRSVVFRHEDSAPALDPGMPLEHTDRTDNTQRWFCTLRFLEL